MKKLFVFFLLFSVDAYAAEMVNVEYIHKLIKQQWGVEVPYSPKLGNVQYAANMEYLLTVIDCANKILNYGVAITDYGNSEYATMVAADTIATNNAVSKLIRKEVKFAIETTPDTGEFSFTMSSYGNFFVYWGDGIKQTINKSSGVGAGVTGCNLLTYTHAYETPGTYKIGFGGTSASHCTYATSTNEMKYHYPAISFEGNKNVAQIAGSLGKMFPTVKKTSGAVVQPKFYRTFSDCTNLGGEIPENLFFGISDTPGRYMFYETFKGCTGLSGPSARIDDVPMYEIWPEATTTQVGRCYKDVTELSDYAEIPDTWK